MFALQISSADKTLSLCQDANVSSTFCLFYCQWGNMMVEEKDVDARKRSVSTQLKTSAAYVSVQTFLVYRPTPQAQTINVTTVAIVAPATTSRGLR